MRSSNSRVTWCAGSLALLIAMLALFYSSADKIPGPPRIDEATAAPREPSTETPPPTAPVPPNDLRQDPPQRVTEEAPPPALDPEPEVTFRLIDLATGEPVVAAELTVALPGGDADFLTDGNGEICVPGSHFLELTSEAWTIVERKAGTENRTTDLLAYRRMELQVVVRGRSSVNELDYASVSSVLLGGSLDLGGAEDHATGVGSTLRRTLLAKHDLDRVQLPGLDSRGVVLASVPRLPGYRISVNAPGWTPVSQDVPHTEERAVVSLVLEKPSLFVRGSVKGPDGTALANAKVVAYVILEMPLDKVDPSAFREVGHGYTFVGSRRRGIGAVCYQIPTTTDSSGNFTISVNTKGRLFIGIRPAGNWRRIHQDVGNLYSDTLGLEYVATRAIGSVLLLSNDAELKCRRVQISDITDWRHNPTWSDETDEDGRLPTGGLFNGHEYRIREDGDSLGHCFVWEGQNMLDLAKLHRKRASVRALEENR